MYGLRDADQSLFIAMDCAPSNWLVSLLYMDNNLPWATMKAGITLSEFIVEARIWLAIICSHVSRCGNMTNIPVMQAHMIS